MGKEVWALTANEPFAAQYHSSLSDPCLSPRNCRCLSAHSIYTRSKIPSSTHLAVCKAELQVNDEEEDIAHSLLKL